MIDKGEGIDVRIKITQSSIEYGEFIRSMRKAAGITQYELADRLYITPASLSQYERGLVTPRDQKTFEKRLREVVKAEIREKRKTSI